MQMQSLATFSAWCAQLATPLPGFTGVSLHQAHLSSFSGYRTPRRLEVCRYVTVICTTRRKRDHANHRYVSFIATTRKSSSEKGIKAQGQVETGLKYYMDLPIF